MKTISDYAEDMKRDWNERAQLNAKWYINTFKLEQTDEEFEGSCAEDFHTNILLALPALTWRRAPHGLRLLEIGCGIGRMSRRLAGVFGELHGVDVSGEMIRQARERMQDLPNAHFHETSGVDFAAFPDNHFDVIFSAYVFQHIPAQAAIISNIRDAYRVLAPGGVFKFVSSGVSNAEFDAMPKNTWTGAALVESDVRKLASELGAQVISISGDGTQYCWSLLRKPGVGVAPAGEPCRIVLAGRADDLAIQEIPTRGVTASVGLIVSGLAAEEADCNQLRIEWPTLASEPNYAGPQGAVVDDALAGKYEAAPAYQINARIPTEVASGNVRLRLRRPDGRTSNEVTIHLLPPVLPPPVVVQYGNEHDGGVDIYATGLKANIRAFVAGLEQGVALDETQIHVGGMTLQPTAISFLPANGIWELKATLPSETVAQETAISVSYQGRRSNEMPLTIK